MSTDGGCSDAEREEAAAFFADSDDDIVDVTMKNHFDVSAVGPAIAVPPIKAIIDRVCLHPASEKPPPTGNATLTPGPMAHYPMGMSLPIYDGRFGPMHHVHELSPSMANMKAMMQLQAQAQMQYGFGMPMAGKGAGKGSIRTPLATMDSFGYMDRTGIEEFLAWALSPIEGELEV